MILKIDGSGNEIWSKRYSYTRLSKPVMNTNNNSFYITNSDTIFNYNTDGDLLKFQSRSKISNFQNYSLHKNDNGLIEYLGEGDSLHILRYDDDLNLIESFTNITNSPDRFNRFFAVQDGYLSFNQVPSILTKYNKNGEIAWESNYMIPDYSNWLYSNEIIETATEYIIFGTSQKNTPYGWYPLIMKISKTGAGLTYKEIKSGEMKGSANAALSLGNSEYLIAGQTEKNNSLDMEIFLIKMDTTGSQPLNLITFDMKPEVLAYPNPAINSFNILVDSPSEEKTITIFDAQGKLILTKNFSTQQLSIDVKDYNSGVYYYVIYADGKRIYIDKLIKTK